MSNTLKELEHHSLAGNHTYMHSKTSMDKVKQSFSSRLKTSTCKTPLPCIINQIAEKDLIEICEQFPVTNVFKVSGWALPSHSSFRFSLKQKKLLYNYFISGEKSGKKMTAEQVHLVLRKELDVKEYVTTK